VARPADDLVVVHLSAVDLGPDREIGRLRRARGGSGGQVTVSFTYNDSWLGERQSFAIDPALDLAPGDLYTSDGGLAGIFTDCAPDRWGRALLDRRELHVARKESRPAVRLDEWDYLMNVSDAMRAGALRFARPGGGRFLDDTADTVPPTTRLRALEHAAQEFERGTREPTADQDRTLALLLGPGSSLGGARPKANFADERGALWIAKFPSPNDGRDMAAWEYVLTVMAGQASIDVPDVKLLSLGSRHRTFAARRFDRVDDGRRLYASAMTLAEKRDGEEASYLDIVEAITDYGDPDAIEADLEQLFRRVAFNVLVANRDDHLRNHGFLRGGGGWRLAPAFDLNPTPEKNEHTLALDAETRAPDIAVVRESAGYYRLSTTRADVLIGEVRAAARRWRTIARDVPLSADETDLMASAFEAAA
jgi:serine/threonine-protein kinase HipA